jgi:alcohol dehydrogenase class IV
MTVQVFTYSQACPVVFGNGVVSLLGEKAKDLGITRALLVTDEPLTKTPAYKKVCQTLDEAGIQYVVFSGITPDPKDTEVVKGTAVGRENKVDGVIGLGGGSAIDAAKSMNLLLTNPEPFSQYYDVGFNYKPLLPMIGVPTSSGTGSETTIISAITEETTHVKYSLLIKCSLALVDPELTYSLPPSLTAATGMDALAHAAEGITSKGHNPRSDILGAWAISEIFKQLPVAVAEPNNKEARYGMSLASNLAGITFSGVGCHLGHCAAHSLGVKYSLPHSYGCAWALPETMKYCAKHNPVQARIVAKALDIPFDNQTPNEEIGQKMAGKIIDLMRRIKLPSLKDMGYNREDCVSVAPLVMDDGCWVFLPEPIEKKEVEEFLGRIYDTYQ